MKSPEWRPSMWNGPPAGGGRASRRPRERDHVVVIILMPWSRCRHCPHVQLVEEA
jgi:hypothetical protein